ncbi:MAG: transposase [Candidatus Omnitrophota bacterium]|jgi:putative transposase
MESIGNSKKLMVGRKDIIAGAIYHITQRAPGKELLFLEKNDYLRFIFLIKKIKKDFNLHIFCFSLLPNHLHLLIKIEEANLDKAMKKLFQSYAQYFNKKYQRKGHVFCGVYRASLCDRDDYLITASIYIHLNSYKANLIKSPFLYKWHSLDVYVKSVNSTFIDRKTIFEFLSPNQERAGNIYKNLIEDVSGIDYENILENKRAVKTFYEKAFNFIKEKIENKTNFGSELFELEKQAEIFMAKDRVSSVEDKSALRYLIQQLRSRGFSVSEIAKKLGYNRCHIYDLLSNKTG